MYPNVFVAEGFLDEFEARSKELSSYSFISEDVNEEKKRKSLERIRDLFLSCTLKTNLSDKKAIQYFKREFGCYETFRDFIFHRAIKEQRIRTSEKIQDYENLNQCYFTEENFDDCRKKSLENGMIILGKNFLNQSFFLENSFLSEDTDDKVLQVKKAKHPCSSLVVIDGFLFEDNVSKSSKIPNLITLIKNITNLSDLTKPFEVDLIIQNPSSNVQNGNKNDLLNNKYNQILEGLKQESVSLHLYAKEYISEKDRYFITNYSTITIGHPLDRKSNVNCNFYPSNISSQSIKSSYNYWKNKIDLAKKLINETPDKYEHRETKEIIISHLKNDDLKHSIFNY